MTATGVNSVLDAGLIASGIAWMIVRQFTWRDLAGLLRLPLIVLASGVALLGLDLVGGESVRPLEIVVSLGELLLVGVTGTLMGRRYRLRNTAGHTQCRLDRSGLLLWAAFLVIRISSFILAARIGARLLETTGAMLVSFATNRLVASVVVRRRARHARSTRPEGSVTQA